MATSVRLLVRVISRSAEGQRRSISSAFFTGRMDERLAVGLDLERRCPLVMSGSSGWALDDKAQAVTDHEELLDHGAALFVRM